MELEIVEFYLRNKAEIDGIKSKLPAGGDHTLLLAWIEANIAIAQRMWPEHANLLGDLNSTLGKVIKG